MRDEGVRRVERHLFVRALGGMRNNSVIATQIADAAKDVFFPRGSEFYGRGDAARTIYFLVDGIVELGVLLRLLGVQLGILLGLLGILLCTLFACFASRSGENGVAKITQRRSVGPPVPPPSCRHPHFPPARPTQSTDRRRAQKQ